MMTTRGHAVRGGITASYFLALAAMVFWPTPVDRPIDGALAQVLLWIHEHGLPAWLIDYRQVEFTANIALFVPFGVIIALWLPRRFWWSTPAVAVCVSAAIETVQGLILPERVPSIGDVFANTAGALVGAVIVTAVRMLRWRVVARKQTEAVVQAGCATTRRPRGPVA